ncbi:glycoside hydrolase superfamily [Schizophyllum commune]
MVSCARGGRLRPHKDPQLPLRAQSIFPTTQMTTETMSAPPVTISSHTTASHPRPHILYAVRVGEGKPIFRRYSEFAALAAALPGSFSLPPKRLLTTTFVPSAWADDALIAERKAGLSAFLNDVLRVPELSAHPALKDFLGQAGTSKGAFDPEDALPSTMSRKDALNFKTKAASQIVGAYYPDWSTGTIAPENIDFSKYDLLFFAFATPNQSNGLNWDDGSQSTLKRLVSAAHGAGTKVVLSVGGWGGSYWFSNAVSSKGNRSAFSSALADTVSQYNLDGVDIDWEYPNSEGAGNPHNAADAANLLTLLKDIRKKIGDDKTISAAVAHQPWIGDNGSPLSDVSAYASVMDWVGIMNYDVSGASAHPGPNAPLGNLCGTSSHPEASAQAAVKQWTGAGFPASKLMLGVPYYGYVSQSSDTSLTGSFAPNKHAVTNAEVTNGAQEVLGEASTDGSLYAPHPHAKASPANSDESKKQAGNGATKEAAKQPVTAKADLSSYWGQQVAFSTLVSAGALTKKSDGNYGEAGGFTMAWDNCSDTPFLYKTSAQTVVTYDDTYSLNSKAAYARDAGLAGVFAWSLDQDDGTSLVGAVRSGLGK